MFLVAALVFLVGSSVISSYAEENVPYLHIMAKSSVYNVGDRKAIYCKGQNLIEKLNWYANDEKLVEGRSAKNTRVFVERPKELAEPLLVPLIIQSAKIEDSGNWTCRAGNLVDTIEILVGEKARPEHAKDDVTGEEGHSITLQCRANGHPPPIAQWYHEIQDMEDSRILETTDPQKYVLHKQGNNLKLTIRNLAHTDAGEYTCKLTQEALSYYTDKRVSLNVIHKPVIQLVHEQEVYAIMNETKNITCSAKAYPQPGYQWYRRKHNFDDPIPEEGSIFTSEDGSSSVLMLRMYDQDSLGEYKCTVNNTRGSVSVVFHVSLGNKPEPPDYVEVIGRHVNELVFNVSCSNCTFTADEEVAPRPENLKVLGYSFLLVPDKPGYPPNWDEVEPVYIPIGDPWNTSFPVAGLPNTTIFHVRVRSCNAAGCSIWADVSPDPSTTNFAINISATLLILLVSFMLLQVY